MGANPYKDVDLAQAVTDVKPGAVPSGEMQCSVLENGMSVVSVDQGGLASSVGLYVNAGSRFESLENLGVAHMCEMVAFRSTAHLSHLRIGKTLEQMGVKADAKADREMVLRL